jgi:NAD(P)H-dependent flavin oxidoreductase YrpB (nitropropane dioxygenase family)
LYHRPKSSSLITHSQVGTRFVAATEASAPKAHKDALLSASYEDAVTTLIYTGRPLRVRRSDYIDDWLISPYIHPLVHLD